MDNLAVKSGDSATVDLTDTDGKSWVYLSTGTSNKQEVTPGNPTCEFEGLTWTVSYSGTSNTAAKIQAEWALLISDTSKDHASVAVTSDTGNAHVVRFGDTGSSASACTDGPYTLLADISLSEISWADVTPTGTTTYTASISLTSHLTKKAFAVALTGTDVNEGKTPTGTNGFTVATTLA